MRDRQLLTIDVEEIKAHVCEGVERLSRRVPEARIQVYQP